MDDNAKHLAYHRLENSKQCIISAKKLVEINDYKGAANRSYYAIFHAMRSILALDGIDFSKHSGVSSYFRREYIKTEILPKELSRIILDAFEIRGDSDYDDYYVLSKRDVEEQIDNAKIFYDEIMKYVSSKCQ